MKRTLLFLFFAIGLGYLGWGQPWTYNFGTGTGSFTSSTASTTFLPTPPSGTARVRVGTNPGSIVMANPGLAILGTDTELQITSNTGSTSTTKFSVYDYTAGKAGYVKFYISFSGGTNGVYMFTIGDGANFSDNNAIATSQIFAGIRWTFGASNAITYNVLNNTTWGTTGISNSTTTFTQSTTVTYLVEVYCNNNNASVDYTRSATNYTLSSDTWDMWVDGTRVGTGLASGAITNNVNIDSYAFNHQTSASAPGTIYLDDIEYSNTLPLEGSASITVSPSTLSGFTYIISAGPSSEQNFTVSGSNLTTDITVTPPTDYEISTGTGGSFVATNPITLTQSGGSVTSTTIYARLKAGLAVGSYNTENIAASSTGATTQNVSCSGTVTYSPEPSNHPTSFVATTNSASSITNTWADNDGAQVASGFLVMANTTGTFTNPVDGTPQTTDTDMSDNVGVQNIAHGTQTAVWNTGMTPATPYYFKIFPYNGSGSSINYKTDGTVPTANATTNGLYDNSSEVSGPALVSQPDPVGIPSTATTEGTAIRVFDMDVYDYGVDGVATNITQLTIKAGLNNTANWATVIAGVRLSTDEGLNFVPLGTPVITSTSIVIPVAAGNLLIPETDALTISLYVYLNSTGLTDNQILEFKVDQTASQHGFLANATGSGFLSTFASAPVSNQILIDVTASKLNFVQQPTTTLQNSTMLPAVTIEATDANGNRDLDKTGTVDLTSTGTMTGPVTASLTNGFGSSGSIVHTAAGSGLTLTASLIGLTDGVSNTFSITSIINAGSILFVAYGTDDPDKFAFVTTEFIPEGTQITFTDNAWTGTVLNSNEGSGVYTVPSGGLAKGTVIQISGTTVTGGGTVASNTMSFSTSGDQILAYQGSSSSPTFIAGVSSTGWINTGTPTTNNSYLPTPLVQNQNATGFSSEDDNGYYTGPMTLANGALPAFICNASNWTRSSTIQTLPTMTFNFGTSTVIDITSTVASLTIASGETLTIQPNKGLTVSGTLTNNAGTSGLLIKSDASGTGSLIHNSNNIDATIERYLTGNSNTNGTDDFHLVSVPLNADGVAGIFTGMYLYQFNQGTQLWAPMGGGTETVLDNNLGYMIFYPNTNTTVSMTGQLNNGSFTALTATDAADEFSLVPNPYPSAINWDAASGWTKTNLQDAFYIWDPVNNNYVAWGSASGAGTGGLGTAASANIPVGQSFFVKSNAASPELTMTNAVRAHSTQAFYKETETIIPEVFRMKVTDSESADEMIVRFSNEAAADRGFLDVDKLYGADNAPQLYSVSSNDEKLTINALDHSTQTIVVPVGIEYPESKSLTFNASGFESFESSVSIFLEDKLLNKTIDLRENPVYSFTHAAGADPMRFNLMFYGVNSSDELGAANYNIWANNDKINVQIPDMTGRKAVVQLIDQQGRILDASTVTLNSPSTIQAPLCSGLYIVRVIVDNQAFTSKVFIR